MKYLLFENKEQIPVEALYLIGASSKREDNSKIGFFGSGLKYSIPVLMREEIKFRIFSGVEEIGFSTRQRTMREMKFDVITINEVETSLTVQMGPQWKLWFAIREIYSNMLDETAPTFSVSENEPQGQEGHTRIYIEMTDKKVEEIYNNFELYFSEFRNDVVCFDTSGNTVFEKSSEKINVYRKGIRCYDDKSESIFDYNFDSISINESRVTNSSDIHSEVAKFWIRCDNPKAILRLLEGIKQPNTIERTATWYFQFYISSLNQKAWQEALQGKRLVPEEFTGYMDDFNPVNDLPIPKDVYYILKDKTGTPPIGFDAQMPYKLHTCTPYQDAMLKRAITWFEQCMSPITYKINVVSFLDENLYGLAKEGEIYICQKSFIKGNHFLVATLLEEQMHLQYRVKDEERPFQNLLLEHVIYYMSQINANPL